MKEKSNIIKIVDTLIQQGYTEEFRVTAEKLYWVQKAVKYSADQFEVDQAYRLESSDTSGDTSLVYGISIPKKGIKGILVDVFDTLTSLEDNATVHKVLSTGTTVLPHDDSEQSLKFGFLPKVHKSKFNEDPHRYELRFQFPDFPPCPFGQHFSMLGYDRKLSEYVWLTTGILKDERLEAVNYRPESGAGMPG